MRAVHILPECADSILMVSGAVRMIIIYRNLACIVWSAHRHSSCRVIFPEQDAHYRIRPFFSRIPCFQYCIRILIGCIAGYGPPAEMYQNHRFSKPGHLLNQFFLAKRQIDIGTVDPLSHGSGRTGPVFAAYRHQNHIRLFGNPKRFLMGAAVRSGIRIPIGIQEIGFRYSFLQFLQKVIHRRSQFFCQFFRIGMFLLHDSAAIRFPETFPIITGFHACHRVFSA